MSLSFFFHTVKWFQENTYNSINFFLLAHSQVHLSIVIEHK